MVDVRKPFSLNFQGMYPPVQLVVLELVARAAGFVHRPLVSPSRGMLSGWLDFVVNLGAWNRSRSGPNATYTTVQHVVHMLGLP
mmetsp:Transcript_79510/g.257519  ORF Transcript_79510/g.257519 Transcript_79510/m.257519 type:complete len:84 (-) Transcript_79510:133-384(-)